MAMVVLEVVEMALLMVPVELVVAAVWNAQLPVLVVWTPGTGSFC